MELNRLAMRVISDLDFDRAVSPLAPPRSEIGPADVQRKYGVNYVTAKGALDSLAVAGVLLPPLPGSGRYPITAPAEDPADSAKEAT